ncbi:uncharacterized protein LOC124209965 [Daphnia pulex]|uniref:uncharacterized protein LOC124209965 n=1 Tax=Daphnia pulex TaxID=6669 RepID=UPI001EDD5555|nr:uncharacterized protein LOC124209965 [Daphnia pulex]
MSSYFVDLNDRDLDDIGDNILLDLNVKTLPSALPKEPSVSLDDGNLTSYRKLLFSKLDLIVKGLNSLQSEKTRNAVIFEGNLVNFTKTFTDSVTLPLNDYSELVALDLALGSVELSVSMVGVFVQRLRTYNTESGVSKKLWSSILSGTLAIGITWKVRLNDARPAYGHMINLVAVLAVIIQLIMESTEKTLITILKMIKVIQDGRRNVAWSFNTKIGNKQRNDPVPMRESSLKDQLDSDTVTKIDARITKITKSFKTFGLN